MITKAFHARILYALLTTTWILCCFGVVLAQQPTGSTEEPTGAAEGGTVPAGKAAAPIEKAPEFDDSKTIGEHINEKPTGGAGGGLEDQGWVAVLKMLFWMVLVVAAIYGGARLIKRYVPAARNMFGAGTLKVVGRTFLSPKQSILLVRVGRRMLVVGVTPASMSALAEISDPEELEYINNEMAGSGKGRDGGEFKQNLKEAADELESGRELLDSTSLAVADGDERAEMVDGLRGELDSIARKINLWRGASD